MNQVIAYIKPHKLENVMLALHRIEGLTGISILEMRGCGRTRNASKDYIFDEDSYGLIAHLKLEIVCRSELVEKVISAIRTTAYTGLKGDGKIYVLPVLEAVRISTGETGDMAV